MTENSTIVYGKDNCIYCQRAKFTLDSLGEEYEYKTLGADYAREDLLELFPNAKQFPQIVYKGVHVGGYDGLVAHLENLNDYNGQ